MHVVCLMWKTEPPLVGGGVRSCKMPEAEYDSSPLGSGTKDGGHLVHFGLHGGGRVGGVNGPIGCVEAHPVLPSTEAIIHGLDVLFQGVIDLLADIDVIRCYWRLKICVFWVKTCA